MIFLFIIVRRRNLNLYFVINVKFSGFCMKLTFCYQMLLPAKILVLSFITAPNFDSYTPFVALVNLISFVVTRVKQVYMKKVSGLHATFSLVNKYFPNKQMSQDQKMRANIFFSVILDEAFQQINRNKSE